MATDNSPEDAQSRRRRRRLRGGRRRRRALPAPRARRRHRRVEAAGRGGVRRAATALAGGRRLGRRAVDLRGPVRDQRECTEHGEQFNDRAPGVAAGGNSSSAIRGFGPAPRTYSTLDDGGVYFNNSPTYSPPLLHECELKGLAPRRATRTRCGGVDTSERVMSFVTPPWAAVDAFSFAVAGDVGYTSYSNSTMHGVRAWAHDTGASTLLWPGDLSYAEGDCQRWAGLAYWPSRCWARSRRSSRSATTRCWGSENFVPLKALHANPNVRPWQHATAHRAPGTRHTG
jgi:hypothetical protein